jgi:hypothetical protein
MAFRHRLVDRLGGSGRVDDTLGGALADGESHSRVGVGGAVVEVADRLRHLGGGGPLDLGASSFLGGQLRPEGLLLFGSLRPQERVGHYATAS